MGISVTCPNGHVFRVKDKYAGKKGLCPFCPGQVAVRVPEEDSTERLQSAAFRAVREEHGGDVSASVLDDSDSHESDSSVSLLGSSVMRHNIKCTCGERVPMWFAKCPKCGRFLEQW